MSRCEDYPCCGHGPVSTGGDDGGCPDENGCFDCVLCGSTLPRGNHSSICDECIRGEKFRDPDDRDFGPDVDPGDERCPMCGSDDVSCEADDESGELECLNCNEEFKARSPEEVSNAQRNH